MAWRPDNFRSCKIYLVSSNSSRCAAEILQKLFELLQLILSHSSCPSESIGIHMKDLSDGRNCDQNGLNLSADKRQRKEKVRLSLHYPRSISVGLYIWFLDLLCLLRITAWSKITALSHPSTLLLKTGEIRVKSIDPEDVIERIFSPTGSGILPESIPLPQMVDILIDFWEADGLFD